MPYDAFHALSAQSLRISRGMQLVLDGFDLTLKPAQATVLNGANGSGKTTLLRALAGLLPLDHGTITLNGVNIQKNQHYLLENTIYIGHKDGLAEALTAAENIKIWAKTHNIDANDTALWHAFNALGIAPLMHSPTHRLSQGQRRRTSLARLAISQQNLWPKPLWLLDEPMTALDPQAAASLTRIIDQHTEAGGAALISSHTQLELARMRVLDLNHHALSLQAGSLQAGSLQDGVA